MTTLADTLNTDNVVTNIKGNSDAAKALLGTGAEITDENSLLISDPKQNMKSRISVIQNLALQLKNSNLQGPRRVEVDKHLTESIESYILFMAACINNNLIETDESGILKGDAESKYFKKSCGHINAKAKAFLAKQEKVAAHKGAKVSETELAKLIETPYEYVPTREDATEYDANNIAQVEAAPEVNGDTVVEINCTDGSKITVDKNDSAMYVEVENESGEKITFKRKVMGTAYTWFETGKNIAVAFLGLVWDLVKCAGLFVGSLVTGTIGTLTGSVVGLTTNIGKSGSTFMGRMKAAHTKAKEKALLKGIIL